MGNFLKVEGHGLWDELLTWYKYLCIFLFLDTFVCRLFFCLGNPRSFSIGYELDSFDLKPEMLSVLQSNEQQWLGLCNWCFYLTEVLYVNLSRESDYDSNYHFFRPILVPGSVVLLYVKEPLQHHTNPARWVLLFLSHRWGNWGLERLNN